MGKWSLRSGLISGGSMVLLFFLFHFLFMKDFNAEMWELGEVIGYSSMLLALTAIFFGIKGYRDNVLGGKISFGKAFGLGLGISAVASFIFGIYIYLLYEVISPGLSGKMIEVYRQKIQTSGETQQVIAEQLARFESEAILWNNSMLQAFIMLLTVFMIGMLISLVSAAILKRKTVTT